MHASCFRETDMEKQPDVLNLAPDDALSVLEYWQASGERLMFVYRRSDGVFTQTGRGCIRQATPSMLKFATPDGEMEILVCNAAFEFGSVADADGLLVCLQNADRLYLRAADSG